MRVVLQRVARASVGVEGSLVSEIGPALKTISPRYAERVPLDNASLLARRVYASDLDVFDLIYEREGRDLRRAIGRTTGHSRLLDIYKVLDLVDLASQLGVVGVLNGLVEAMQAQGLDGGLLVVRVAD